MTQAYVNHGPGAKFPRRPAFFRFWRALVIVWRRVDYSHIVFLCLVRQNRVVSFRRYGLLGTQLSAVQDIARGYSVSILKVFMVYSTSLRLGIILTVWFFCRNIPCISGSNTVGKNASQILPKELP
jgi:hypothetical protein